MQTRSTWSLRELLYLLTASVVLPGASLLAYSVYTQYQESEEAAASATLNLAQLTSDNVHAFLMDAQQTLEVLAQRPEMQAPGCGSVYKDFKNVLPQFSNLSRSSPAGYIVCSSTLQVSDTYVGDAVWFKQVYSTRSFTVGPVYRGPVTGRLVSVLAQPILDSEGVMTGALQTPIDLLRFRLIPGADKLQQSTIISILDAEGTMVARSQEPGKFVGRNLRGTPIVDLVLSQKQGTARSTSSQGIERFYGFLPIPGTDWFVVAGISTDVALAGAQQAAIRNLSVGIGLLVTVLLLAIYLSKRIASPVLAMRDAARHVAAGQLQARAPVSGPREITEVATQFNTMLDAIAESKLQLDEVQSHLHLLGTCVERLNDIVIIMDARKLDQGWPTITYVNESFEKTMGYTRAEMIGHSTQMLHGPGTSQETIDQLRSAWVAIQPVRTEILDYTQSGHEIWVQIDVVPIKDDEGTLVNWVSIERNITPRKNAELALRSSEERLKRALDGSQLALWDLDLRSGNVYLSASWSGLLGGPHEPVITNMRELSAAIPPEDRPLIREAMVAALKGQTDNYMLEHRIIDQHGKVRWILSHGRVTERDASGRATRGVGINRDITERKAQDAEINQLAYYDVLTGLPNRRLLMNRLAQWLATAKRTGHTGAILFVDLDRFKSVNDARGHAVGDALLQGVAERLNSLLREGDTVARMGGDEFVILLSDLGGNLEASAMAAMSIAEKVRAGLERPMSIDGQSVVCGASIGVTLMPRNGQSHEDLLREADIAMYRAKTAGRNQIAFFEAGMQTEVQERLAFEHDLALAIERKQLSMYLQPQVDHSGQAVGAELLMRWHHPERGDVPPSQFIPVAEETGLILRLGDWTLREGCRILLRLHQAGRPLPLSINVSPRQFRQTDFVEQVKTVLLETGAPASELVFEITEGLLIDHLDDSIERMRELASLGIRFSIDDFGTGYSSLAYLKRLPLYELKIDKGFVHDALDDTDNSEIVQLVISMAKQLHLRVVAEGVETSEQAAFLSGSGCDSMQGYLFARPMPVEDWLKL